MVVIVRLGNYREVVIARLLSRGCYREVVIARLLS